MAGELDASLSFFGVVVAKRSDVSPLSDSLRQLLTVSPAFDVSDSSAFAAAGTTPANPPNMGVDLASEIEEIDIALSAAQWNSFVNVSAQRPGETEQAALL